MNLGSVKTREEAINFLEGYSEERKEELSSQKSRRPLVKSYMLETVPRLRAEPPLKDIFLRFGHSLTRLDETLFKVRDDTTGDTVALLENLIPRHPVIYTCEESKKMDPWVNRLMLSSPALDRLWLSGRAFEELLKVVMRFSPPHRYGRLVFQHTNLFEATEDFPGPPSDDEESDESELAPPDYAERVMPDAEEESFIPERRTTRSSVVERLDKLKRALPQLRDIYSPLHAVAQLRFPARGAGGHDFYFNGKATNRSDSFADHRQHLLFVLRVYKQATEATERTAWQAVERTTMPSGAQQNVVTGAPVRLAFSEPLPQTTFDRFINATFQRSANKFRLWGNPIRLGPCKVHVYGLDRHLWQPLFLEITDRQIVVIVPEGTCGNTIHRLVTNVQQFLDPGVNVWVGDLPYSELIQVRPDVGSVYDENSR